VTINTADYVEIGDWFASRYYIPTDDNRREERWAIVHHNSKGELVAVCWRRSKAEAVAYIDAAIDQQGCGQ